MSILWSLGAFIVAIAILVPIHEFGHYATARLFGVRVLRYSFGFGRVLLRRQKSPDSTEWVVGAIPLGGYVKMLDEREQPVPEADLPFAFNRKPVAQRIAIVAAGPIANLALAIFIYWFTFMLGVTELRPILAEPPPKSLAASVGLVAGDQVTKVGSRETPTWSEVRWALLKDLVEGESVSLSILRGTSTKEIQVAIPSNGIDMQQGDPLSGLGFAPERPVLAPVVGTVLSGGPADRAGLKPGDRFKRLGTSPVATADEVASIVRRSSNQHLDALVERNGADIDVILQPALRVENGQEVGKIDIAFAADNAWRTRMVMSVSYGPFESLAHATQKAWDTTVFSLKVLGRLISGQLSIKTVSGPVAIAGYAGESAQRGIDVFIGFVAFLSLSIAIFNLLPIPVLDGGHIMYYLAEVVLGRPVRQATLEAGQQVGMVVLISLMVVALYNDLSPVANSIFNDFGPMISRLKIRLLS
ncbi:sigma E protease regulator RseP [Niveibacterium umoris]|uniref:Zinc metalloprotease n=1 Tax=Niveibacterium umoris TaxID=1193620 RepID=A0A840BIS5_9RHOO|nr:regulator of sigma E protease [Niveibacterium umoris]